MAATIQRRFLSTTLKDRVLRSMGVRTRDEITISEEHLPKFYANAVHELKEKYGAQYGDYANSQVVFNWQDDYEFIEKIFLFQKEGGRELSQNSEISKDKGVEVRRREISPNTADMKK